MKLIGSAASPYVRKVRVVMAEKRLDYQFVIEDVWSADTTIASSNPLGKVPCLIMDGSEAMFDSRVIVEYLDTLSPVGKLIPAAKPRARRSQDLGGTGRRRDGRRHPLAPRGHLGRPGRRRAQPGLDGPPARQGRSRHRRHGQGPGRQALLQRHPPEPVGHRGRLRARLGRLPLPRHRLARRPHRTSASCTTS